jgi:glyoxylase-like metal-dependent hydrolase (beta-lactamase superfamily II)
MKIYSILKGVMCSTNFGSPGFSSSYLIQTENYNILFDVGHNGLRNVLTTKLKQYGIDFKSINFVILSHDHWDHVMNYSIFQNSKFIIGKIYEKNRDNDWAYVPFLEEELNKMDTLYIEKDQEIKLDDRIRIISVPGHTEGHIATIIEENNEIGILAGDTIPSLSSFLRGRPDLIFYSEKAAISSFNKLLSYSPTIIFPGHDTPFRTKSLTYLSEKERIEVSVSSNAEIKIKNPGLENNS